MSFFSLLTPWSLKDELLEFLLALRDQRTPTSGKILALLSVLYLLSPIDVLPDSIPLAGVLDDFLMVPLGLWFARRRIPNHVLEAAHHEAKRYHGILNTIAGFILAILTLWLVIALTILYLLVRAFF